MTTYYQIKEDDLIAIADVLILADEMIEDDPNDHWFPKYSAVETIIENTFKNNKLYKASLV